MGPRSCRSSPLFQLVHVVGGEYEPAPHFGLPGCCHNKKSFVGSLSITFCAIFQFSAVCFPRLSIGDSTGTEVEGGELDAVVRPTISFGLGSRRYHACESWIRNLPLYHSQRDVINDFFANDRAPLVLEAPVHAGATTVISIVAKVCRELKDDSNEVCILANTQLGSHKVAGITFASSLGGYDLDNWHNTDSEKAELRNAVKPSLSRARVVIAYLLPSMILSRLDTVLRVLDGTTSPFGTRKVSIEDLWFVCAVQVFHTIFKCLFICERECVCMCSTAFTTTNRLMPSTADNSPNECLPVVRALSHHRLCHTCVFVGGSMGVYNNASSFTTVYCTYQIHSKPLYCTTCGLYVYVWDWVGGCQ